MRYLWLFVILAGAPPCAAEVQTLVVEPMAGGSPHWQLGGHRVFYTLGKSRLAASTEQPREGAPTALKLVCDFTEPRRSYLSAYWVGGPIPGECRELSFRMHGAKCGCRVRLSIEDARGRWFDREIGAVDWEGWKELRAPVGDGKGWRFLGRRGEKPLPILHPVTLKQIAVHRHAAKAEEAGERLESFYLSDLRATTDAEALDFVSARLSTEKPANLFYLGETPVLNAELSGDPNRPVEGRLTAVVTDFFHKERALDLGAATLPAGGTLKREVRIPTDRQGIYEVRLLLRAGERERVWFGRFAVAKPLPPRPPDAAALFGNQFNLHEFPADQKATVVRLNRDAGIRWTRQSFHWPTLNPAEGVFAWDGPRRVEGAVGRAVAAHGQPYRRAHSPALTCTDAVTLAFWAKVDAANGAWQFPLSKWGADNRRNYGAYFHQSTGNFFFTASFTGTPERAWTDLDSGFRAWDGRWHHYAATYSAQAKQVVLYVDGTPRKTYAHDGGALCTNDEDLTLGNGVPGALDEVLLYRRALSPGEVATLAGKHTPPAEGMIAWWSFDGPGAVLKDGSPNALHIETGVTDPEARARYSLESGQKVLGLLGFPPVWASTAPEGAARPWVHKPRLDAWAAFVEGTTRRYRDVVQHWELWNEPNIDVFWQPKPDAGEFFDVVRVGYEAAKRGNPECTVIMPGLAGPGDGGWGMEFLDELLKMGAAKYCDAIAIHPYRQSTPEESDLVGDLRHISDLAAKHGGRRKIWYTEECWTTQVPGGSTEERQGRMLARAYVLSLGSGLVERLIWFRLHDSGKDRFYSEDNYGMCYNDLTPKPAWFAQRTVATLLEGAVPEGAWDIGPRAMAHSFRVGNERVAAFWSPEGSARVALYTGRPSVRAVDLMGNETTVPTPGGVWLADATEDVLFLRGLAKEAAGRGTPVSLDAAPLVRGGTARVALKLRNPYATTQRVSLAVTAPGGITLTGLPASATLVGNTTRVLPLSATVAQEVEPGWQSLSATVVMAGRTLREELPLAVRGAAPDAGPVGWWKLDEGEGEVLHDASPAGNHGTVESPRWVPGKRGTALQFDGKGIAVIPDSPSLNLGDAVTLAFWLKPLGDTGTWQFPVTKYFQENIRRNYGFYLAPGKLTPAFSASFEKADYAHTDFGAPVELEQGRWYHLAATYSLLEKRVRVYVDGELKTDRPLDSGKLLLTTDPIRFGTGTTGALDEVMVFPRALTPEEIAGLAR